MRFPKTLLKKMDHGYIYNDGVVIVVGKTKQINGQLHRYEQSYIFPFTVPIDFTRYDLSYEERFEEGAKLELFRIVISAFRGGGLFANGISRIRITLGNLSEHMEDLLKQGINVNNVLVTITDEDGFRHDYYQWEWMSGVTHTQFVKFDSPVNKFGGWFNESGSVKSHEDFTYLRQLDEVYTYELVGKSWKNRKRLR